MNETTIKKALRKGERVTLECKKAMAEVPRSLWETYSAFANTLGGLILLGVDEHSNETNVAKRYEIVGVTDAQKILTDFWNTINSDKVNVNILTDSDVEVINISGKQIGFGENVGSGFPKIVAAWKQTNWGEPQLLNKLDVDEVELVLPVPVTESEESEEVSVNSSDGVSKDWSNWSKGLSNELSKGLSNTTINIFKMIVTDNHISREVLAEKTGISVVSVHKHIKKLKSVGLIKRIGSSRYGHWEVAENKEDGFFATQDVVINGGKDVVINDENVGINDGKDVVINDENVGIKLTERQRVILEMITLNPFLSAKKISEKISEKTSEKGSEKGSEKSTITDRTIEKDLAQLKKKGILKRIGGRKKGQWIVTIVFVSENDSENTDNNAFVSENDSQSDTQGRKEYIKSLNY